MEELVWRKNEERCERSYRPVPKEFIPAQEQKRPAPSEQYEKRPAPSEQYEKRPAPSEHRTPAQAPIPDNGFRQISNKREEANSKINDRYLIGQATQNPFMASNNYINDIEVQMNFLTPQRSG
jgi:hypothetical protein